MSATITTWFLTYLVHSTVLLGAAWLTSRILGETQLGLQEALLRAALIGGIVTASLQVGFGLMPLTGAFSMDSIRLPEVSSAAITADDLGRIADATTTRVATTAEGIKANWAGELLALWIAGSLMALLGLGRSVLDLRRLLQTRRLQPAGRLLERLATAMGLGKKVRFSTSAAIAVPFATGISRPEICCPERVKDLAIEHRTALFAHELAHLARRDPAWQLLYRIGEAFLFPQPLNRLVRRRLEEIAEHLTDERAVSCTGNRLGLARCLVVIAHWGTAAPLGVPAAAFASGPRLDRRVRRLISGSAGSHRCAPWTVPLVITILLGFAVVLPLIAPTRLDADQTRKGTEVAPVRTWSFAIDNPQADVPPAPEPPAVIAAAEANPPDGTAPTPKTPPISEAAPPALPAPSSAPAPVVAPQPPVPPETAPRDHERAAEDERDRQSAVARKRSDEAAHIREQARALAREAARQEHNMEASREDFRQQALAMRAQAETEHHEEARAARELSRRLVEEARKTIRETAARVERLTDEQREEFRRRADQYLAEARERSQEAARLSRERARALAEEARVLAEEAETRRLAE